MKHFIQHSTSTRPNHQQQMELPCKIIKLINVKDLTAEFGPTLFKFAYRAPSEDVEDAASSPTSSYTSLTTTVALSSSSSSIDESSGNCSFAASTAAANPHPPKVEADDVEASTSRSSSDSSSRGPPICVRNDFLFNKTDTY
jgi:hypothetical protein